MTVDYLLGGSDKMVLAKKLMKRIEDIEALPEKEKIFDYIDLVIRDNQDWHKSGGQYDKCIVVIKPQMSLVVTNFEKRRSHL